MSLPALRTYQDLLRHIREEILSGQKIIEHQKALTYWTVGKNISDFILKGKDRAGYGEKLYEKLSEDLEIGAKTLEQSVRFSREFPIPNARSELTWTHYRALLAVDNKGQRKLLEQKIIREDLSARELEKILPKLKSVKTIDLDKPVAQLGCVRGKLYTYRLIEPKNRALPKGFVVVDCGFNVRREIPDPNQHRVLQHPVLIPGSQAAAKDLFTFKAVVEKVIDSDTLWVEIDCGFETFIRQKLRLKGIDAPEIATSQGKKAKRFVEKILKPLDFIVIKTYQSDKYDRYLADIFYLIGEPDAAKVAAQGRFLNQELLDARLAVLWKE